MVVLLATLDGPLRPRWVTVMVPLTAAAYLVSGVIAWLRRPSSEIGALLSVGCLAWLVTGFANTDSRGLVALGLITATAPLALIVHLLVTFPSGRLSGRLSWAIVVVGYFVALVLQIPLYTFTAYPPPYDLLQIADRSDLFNAAVWVQRGVGLGVMAVTSAELARRLYRATPSQRYVLAPLYAYGIVAILLVPLSPTVLAPQFGWSVITTYVVQLSVMAIIPVAFGWSIIRGGFAPSAEIEELGAWFGVEERARSTLRAALANTLGDPTLELLFWVPDRQAYVDAAGRPAQPAVGHGRGLAEVDLSGRRVGAISYALDAVGDPGLVRSAGRIIAVAVDRERLTAELRANEAALRESRQRIVESGDRERRRIERNLHDGARQRILAVLLALRGLEVQLSASGEPGQLSLATRAADELEDAIRELRELARGLHPRLLSDVGLRGALEGLAERSAVPVSLAVGLDGSLSESAQVAVYFVVAEALTNAARHAAAEHVDIRATADQGLLRLDVVDDGVGGAVATPGSGLEGLVDRVDSLGGRLQIESAAGAGTRITAELPCA